MGHYYHWWLGWPIFQEAYQIPPHCRLPCSWAPGAQGEFGVCHLDGLMNSLWRRCWNRTLIHIGRLMKDQQCYTLSGRPSRPQLGGVYISAIKALRTEQNSVGKQLQDKEQECAKAHADSPSPATLAQLQFARRNISLHYHDVITCQLERSAARVFEKGDKNGKLLALLTAGDTSPTVVPCIMSPSGQILRDGEDIIREFVSFYRSLYSPID